VSIPRLDISIDLSEGSIESILSELWITCKLVHRLELLDNPLLDILLLLVLVVVNVDFSLIEGDTFISLVFKLKAAHLHPTTIANAILRDIFIVYIMAYYITLAEYNALRASSRLFSSRPQNLPTKLGKNVT